MCADRWPDELTLDLEGFLDESEVAGGNICGQGPPLTTGYW